MNAKRHSETSFLDIVSGYFDTDEESDEEEMQPSLSLTPVNHFSSQLRRPTVVEAMETERFLLRKRGEEELANRLYEKSSLINNHIGGADIEVDYELGLVGVKKFIIERCLRDFRVECDEMSEDFEFLQDNWKVLTSAVIRMGNLNPEDFKSEIENYHMEAHNMIILERVSHRRKMVDEMIAARREKCLKDSQEMAIRKRRVQIGEESSGDEELENELQADYRVQQKYEAELRNKFENMGIRLPDHRMQELVVNMVSNLRIRSEQSTPERCSSPPRRQHLDHTESSDDGKESCVNSLQSSIYPPFAYCDNGEGSDEFDRNDSDTDNETKTANLNSRSLDCKCESTDIDFNEESKVLIKSDSFVGDIAQARSVHELSQTIFPEDDHFIGGSKRCNSSHGIESPHASKKRIYDRNMWLSQDVIKEELFTGNDKHEGPVIKGCIKKTKTSYPTDENIDTMSVSERLLWRQRQELQSASKKSVKFVEFNDSRNICRFSSRPRDNDIILKSAVDCAWPMTLVSDLPLSKSVKMFKDHSKNCVNSCSDWSICERFHSHKYNEEQREMYKKMRPSSFVSLLRHTFDTKGVFLPAAVGSTSLIRKCMHNAEIQLRLVMFRDDLRKCREGRAGMKRANHLIHRNDVVGVIITSDTLLENVNPNRLTNTLLQSFNTPHGVNAVITLLEQCSYDYLDIRHYVLAWGHDAIVYHHANPLVAVAKAICGVMKLRAVFRKRYNYFDAQGYRRRVMPKFWLLTIPEIGHFHSEFKEFNETIIRHSSLMRSVHILDWAGAVKMSLPAINWSQFNAQAVEKRLHVLFHLCRQKLDVYYIRSDNEIKSERSSGYWNSIGYHGEDHSILRVT